MAVLAAAYVCAGKVALVEDEPPLRQPRTGDASGRIISDKPVEKLHAVNRFTKKEYAPASFDKAGGKFTFKNLPGDASYDLCVDLPGGRHLEGIDLSFTDSRMLRLAAERRKQLGLPPERTHAFCQDDADQMIKWLAGIKDFTDFRRALYIQGNGRRATMLLEGMRVTEFHASKGTVVWRVELWYFENRFGGWEKLNNQEQVLRRERLTPDEWRKIHVEYFPELSVYVDENGFAKPLEFTVPEQADPSRGRLAGTEPKQDTRTHVLGIEAAEESSAPPMEK